MLARCRAASTIRPGRRNNEANEAAAATIAIGDLPPVSKAFTDQ
jgi:hypothetical protein